MHQNRQNLVGLIVGNRGTGKSTFIKKIIDKHPKKVLVYDTDDNPIYQDYPNISPKLLPRWKANTKRIIDTDYEVVLQNLDEVNNALIVFEDATKYTGNATPQLLKKLILASKQRNLDLLFTFHSFRRILPDFYTFSNYMEIFKTGEDIKQFKAKIPNFEKVQEVHNEVESHTNRFFHKTVRLI